MHEQVKSLEVISAGLAHEIHNPLNYIRTALFVIHEELVRIQRVASDPTQAGDLPELVRAFEAEIGPEELAASGLIRKASARVKVLGRGELTAAKTVRAHNFSASARKKIEDKGGTAVTIGQD